MKILPLRNMVLLRPQNGTKSASNLVVIQEKGAICPFSVMAVGPEVRDVRVGQVVIANRLAATVIGSELLVPETAILGML